MPSNVRPFRVVIDDEPEPERAGVKLHLGCNQHPKPGYLNVDIEKFPGVDVVADLEKRWPWEDGSVDEIYTADLPEHLRQWWDEPDDESLSKALLWADSLQHGSDLDRDFRLAIRCIVEAVRKPKRTYGVIHFMSEAHRVLKTGGRLIAKIPSTESRSWAQDPTHVSYWNENSFMYFCDPRYRGLYPHLIKCAFKALELKTTTPNAYGESWVVAVLEKE